MNNTIKVIDLLVKVANGEEVPKKINYNDKIFEFDELEKVYVTSNFDNSIMQGLDLYIEGLKQDSLNIEVEIIEDKEDINIQDIEHKELEIIQENLGKCDLWKGNEEYILKVINENNSRLVDAILQVSKENGVLVQAVKYLEKTKEDK